MSDLFDVEFYSAKYAGKFAGDPYTHYLEKGWIEGFMPNAFVDPIFYAKANHVDLVEPLAHLSEHWKEGVEVSPAFDPERYFEYYPDVRRANMMPLRHFLGWGRREGRVPGLLFFELAERTSRFPEYDWAAVSRALGIPLEAIDADVVRRYEALIDEDYYRRRYGGRLDGMTVVEHFTARGFPWRFKPNALFDVEWYAERHGIEGVNGLLHHVVTGNRPAPFFCPKSYARRNPDIGPAEEAFGHFVVHGRKETRDLGISPQALASIGKIEASYDWAEAQSVCRMPLVPTAPGAAATEPFVADPLPPRPRSAPDALQMAAIRLRGRNKKLVSIDIWDTLLRRDCDPDEIKLYAATVMLREFERRTAVEGVTSVELYRLRQLAEFRVADLHYEYTHAAMMREWTALAGFAGADAAEVAAVVTEAEISKELAATRVDPTLLAVLAEFGDIRTIAISDFYLPEASLRRILDHHGLGTVVDAIYVSCDLLKTKREGSLFDHVLSAEKVAADDVLHIGDNVRADVTVPREKGIAVYHFVDAIEEARKADFRKTFEGVLRGDQAALLRLVEQRLWATRAEAETVPAKPVATAAADGAPKGAAKTQEKTATRHRPRLGSLDTLAALFAAFGLHILQTADQEKVDKVFFATREGTFYRQVFDLLAARDVFGTRAYPKSVLLEVSRRATFAASLRRISIDEMMRIWSLYATQSMAALARSLNLDETRMEAFCAAHGLSAAEKITYPWMDAGVQELFDDRDFLDWVGSECVRQRDALWRYLEVAGFDPDSAGTRLMVDIGWRGSIQDNLAFTVNGRVDGLYLALFRFVAEQPDNGRKTGFLMDLNRDEGQELGEVAALEFISNGAGGSVVGYADGAAVREIFEGEERVIVDDVLPFQAKILARIDELIPIFAKLPLDRGELGAVGRLLALSYIDDPDREIADMFQRLEHNETFGTGELDVMGGEGGATIAELAGSALHHHFAARLAEVRWSEAWVKSGEFQDTIATLGLDRKLMLPRSHRLVRAPAVVRALGHRISVFAPTPLRGSGGHRTIYNMAKALDAAGFDVTVFAESRGGEYDYQEQELAGSGIRTVDHWFSGIVPDVAIATIQHSAPYVANFFDADVKKFYFIQDFEASFNPMSDGFVRGENSFTEEVTPLCIGRWLTHVLHTQYAKPAATAGLGVDVDIYRPLEEETRRDCIAVLYQPEKLRRLPEVCIDALSKVKMARPQTEIVFYGSGATPRAPFANTHLGLVHDLRELNRIYNRARIGLCISLTNPSRIPFEMMASGCVPVDVYRYNNLFDYEDGTGLLAYQSADSLAAAMLHLLEDEGELATRRAKCIETGASRTLDWETDAEVNVIEHVLEGGTLDRLPVPKPSFTGAPFLAAKDDRAGVRGWCAWQRTMAMGTGSA